MKNTIKTIIIGAAVATFSAALSCMAAQTGQPIILSTQSNHIPDIIREFEIPKPIYGYPTGLTPKEYGMLYGNGKSRKYKTNKKHRSRLLRIRSSKF